MISKMSAKGDKHWYLTNLFAEHTELYRTPHLQQMYSENYVQIDAASK